MLEPGGEADLALEPLRAERLGQLRPQNFQGDGAVVLEIVRQVDRSHAARAELTLDTVAVGEGGGEALGGIGH
jgi:hypothetical protein